MKHAIIDFEVDPNRSAGPLRFGMTAAQVRAQLGSQAGAGEPSTPRDTFGDLGIRVHYGPHDLAEAFEFRGPASPTFQGRPLLRQRFADLEAWLLSIDPGLKLEHSGLTSLRFGIRLYAASARKSPSFPVESVTVFAPEYGRRYIASILPPPPR